MNNHWQDLRKSIDTALRQPVLCAVLALGLSGLARADFDNTEAALLLDSPLVRTGVGAGQQTRGYTFTLDEARTLTHLGLFLHNNTDSAQQPRQIGLWDDADTLVAEVTIPVGGGEIDTDANGIKFLYGELAAPAVLLAGEIYTVGVWYSVDNSPGLAFNVGFTTIPGFNYMETVETGPPGGAFAKPTIARPDRINAYIGPNLRFDLALPDPFKNSLRITDLSLDGSSLTLTWTSKPNKTYIVRWSLDLVSYDGDLADGIFPDDGDTTTRTFDLGEVALDLETKWFIRVEEEP